LIHDVPGRYIAARGHALESQRQALATLEPHLAGDVETYLVNARPAEALIARCGEADLLVIGSGRPEEERPGRRSVGAECLEAAPCPVTVVPNHGQEPEPESPTREQPRHRRPVRRNGSRAATSSSA
jgi:nucleotide-binding universal stress UspA family protein